MADDYANQLASRVQSSFASRGVLDQVQQAQRAQVEQFVPIVQTRLDAPALEEYTAAPIPPDPIVAPPLGPAPTFLQTTGDVARASWPALATAGVLFFGAGFVVGWYRKV